MAHTWTWDKLVKNATRLNPKSRGLKSPYTPKFEMQKFSSGPNRGKNVVVPFIGTKSVLINLRAWGVTQASLHNVTLLFSGVDIKTEDPKSYRYFQIQYDGQMYWISKLDKFRNPLTFRCTCFTGDTKILLADGTYKTFEELEGQEGFDIVSYNEVDDKFEIVKAFNCSKRDIDTPIIQITLDNDKIIKCTPDHRFLLRDGQWIEAQNLKEGDSLRAFYGKNTSQNKLKRITSENKLEIVHKHKEKEDFYVYIYLDPRYPGDYTYDTCSFCFKPIYVGKGHNNRDMEHWNNPTTKSHFHNTLKHLKSIGLEPIILRQHVNLTEHVAYKLENQLTHEIGLQCEQMGPLLNMKHGGEGGLSGVAEVKVKQRMKQNNPMFDEQVAQKVKLKNIQNGCFEKNSIAMKQNNPMFDEQAKNKRKQTINEHYSKEQLSELGKYVANHRTQETWDKISQSHKTSQKAKKAHEQGGKRLAQWNKENAKINNLHTQQPQWKQFVSNISKKNWQDPKIREAMLSKMIQQRQQKKQLFIHNTKNIILQQIKENGWFNAETYIPQKDCYTSILRHKDLITQCYQQIYGQDCNIKEIVDYHKNKQLQKYINHKIKSIQYIGNADVYCLTAEYLGNFVIDSGEAEDDIISGVVVENCKDFFYTWAWPASKMGHCLYGPPPKPYKRKTTWMPPRNPNNIIGCCKHIVNAWKVLADSGLTIN